MNYREYLQSEHWQWVREWAKKRALYRCQLCNVSGDEVVLDVHHRSYKRLWHEHPMDLIVLCRDCHDLFHQNTKVVSE